MGPVDAIIIAIVVVAVALCIKNMARSFSKGECSGCAHEKGCTHKSSCDAANSMVDAAAKAADKAAGSCPHCSGN